VAAGNQAAIAGLSMGCIRHSPASRDGFAEDNGFGCASRAILPIGSGKARLLVGVS